MKMYAVLDANLEEDQSVKRDSNIISDNMKTVNVVFLDFAKHSIR